MKSDKVDPAALLIAIVPFAQTPLTTAGAWDAMNSVLALVVLTVLWGYALADPKRRQARSPAEGVAVGVVIGVVSAIALAYPIQWLLSGKPTSAPAIEGGPPDSDVNLATWSSLAIGLIIAAAVAVWLWRSRPPIPPDPAPPDPLQRLTEEVVELRKALERHPVPSSIEPAGAMSPATEQALLRPLLVVIAGELRRRRRGRGTVG